MAVKRGVTRNVVIGTAGHIDHGKSALVQALTGIDPDRLQEEKARGITIDLGFAHCVQDDVNLAFVDVPGHERFVRNMLAGVSSMDAVLLVIAADESVMPQTREHFDICRLLGVDAGVVALSKIDLVDAETLELVRLETRELLKGTPLEDAPVAPVSARSGAGLDRLRAALRDVAGATSSRADAGPVRLPIDRAFTMRGFGAVVTGTLVSGSVRVDMGLDLLPARRRVKVRGLQVHGRRRETAGAGQRVAINLHGVDVGALRRGDVLVKPGAFDTTRRFDAVLTLLPSARALKHGAGVRCHHGTAEAMARLSICGPTAAAAGAPAFPSALEPGSESFVRIRLDSPLVLTRGDRFVLRACSPPVTVAGGRVLDPAPPRGRLRSQRGLARLRRLGDADGLAESVVVMVEERGGWGVARPALTRRLGAVPEEIEPEIDAALAAGRVAAVGDLLAAPRDLRMVRKRLLKLAAEFHAAHPLDPGLPREEARERLSRRAAPEMFDHAVAELVAEGALTATGHLALASHRIVLSPAEAQVRERMAELFRAAGLAPPDAAGAAASLGANPELAARMLKLLVREGTLVKVETLLFHAETLRRLKDEVARVKSEAAGPVRIDVGVFKRRFGVTRKYAIPLLGYLDRERVTRRVGDARLVL